MAYSPPVSGTTITSTWGTEVANQYIVPFASTAARSSALTSPVVGQVSTLTANNTTEGIYQYNSGSQWRAPWNLPWGRIGSAVPGSFTFTTVKGVSSNFSITTVANRVYHVIVNAEYQSATATGTVVTMGLETSGGAALITVLARWTPAASASLQDSSTGLMPLSSPGTGSQTWRLNAISSLSATTQTIQPYAVEVLDVGPAGAPA